MGPHTIVFLTPIPRPTTRVEPRRSLSAGPDHRGYRPSSTQPSYFTLTPSSSPPLSLRPFRHPLLNFYALFLRRPALSVPRPIPRALFFFSNLVVVEIKTYLFAY